MNQNNTHLELIVSQLGIPLLIAAMFAALSLFIWLWKGRNTGYFIAQCVGISFILITVVLLVLETATLRAKQVEPDHRAQSGH